MEPASDIETPIPANDEPTVESLQEDLAASRDQLLRMAADLDNTRKRMEKEKTEAVRYAAAHFAKDLLDVADNLSRALASQPSGDDAVATFCAGVQMTETSLLAAFNQHGLEKINPEGQPFNHHHHQAISELPAPEGQSAGIVLQVYQVGWKLHDRLLRPAMVVVSK